MKKLKVAWFSAGVSSLIATYLMNDSIDKVIYIDIDDQHEDSMRFVQDSEKLLSRKIEILKHPLGSVANVVRQEKIIRHSITGYAPCTAILKKQVRHEWQMQQKDTELTYVWGFDLNEQRRADRLSEVMIEYKHEYPLITAGLQKQDCHAMAHKLGIKRPYMYDLGYNNNNCVGCVKGGMGYWNKIRKDFPKVFKARAELEREVKCHCLKECFLDELDPNAGIMSDEINQDCSIFCELALTAQSSKGE